MSDGSNKKDGVDDPFEILQRTNKNNPSKKDVRKLRKTLKDNPGLWRKYGDLARLTQNQIVDSIPANSAIIESIWRAAPEMRTQMNYDEAPLIEQLLIEQVILTWLHFHKTHYTYQLITDESCTLPRADFWERSVNSAQRRYLRAIETLVRVRKLNGRANVQINIAQQQLNVTK